MPERYSEHPSPDVQEAYARFDFEHEPFVRRDTPEERRSPASYPEINEEFVRVMEEVAFHPEDYFPKPDENLDAENPRKKAWEAMMKAQSVLNQGVEKIKQTHPYFIGSNDSSVDSKEPRRAHLRQKREYFQRVLSYLYVSQASSPELQNNAWFNELLHYTESIFVGHMSYAVIRSATHRHKATREDGTLVMDHCYSTCVYIMNRYKEELEQCKDLNERNRLYEEMKIAIVVALGHDYLEDFPKMTPEFLRNKLIELHTFDTIIEDDLRESSYSIIPDTNPFSRNEAEIISCLKALTKPSKESDLRPQYLKRQVEKNKELSPRAKKICAMVKSADRMHNLSTLGPKKISKQVDYLYESVDEVMMVVDAVRKETGTEVLSKDLETLREKVRSLALQLLTNDKKALEETGLTEDVDLLYQAA